MWNWNNSKEELTRHVHLLESFLKGGRTEWMEYVLMTALLLRPEGMAPLRRAGGGAIRGKEGDEVKLDRQ